MPINQKGVKTAAFYRISYYVAHDLTLIESNLVMLLGRKLCELFMIDPNRLIKFSFNSSECTALLRDFLRYNTTQMLGVSAFWKMIDIRNISNVPFETMFLFSFRRIGTEISKICRLCVNCKNNYQKNVKFKLFGRSFLLSSYVVSHKGANEIAEESWSI